MEMQELLKRVKGNLSCVASLKKQMKQMEEKEYNLTEEISNTNKEYLSKDREYNKLAKDLRNKSINELMEYSNVFAFKYDEYSNTWYDFSISFMGETYVIASLREFYDIECLLDTKNLKSSIVENIYNLYFEKGDEVFGGQDVLKLRTLLDSYNSRKNTTTNTLVNKVVKIKTNNLQDALANKQEKLNQDQEKLLEIQEKLSKCKDRKNFIAKKIFGDKDELIKQHDNLTSECKLGETQINSISSKLENKQALTEEAKAYVENELKTLVGVFNWIDNLKENKSNLENFKQNEFTALDNKIENLNENLNDVVVDICSLRDSYWLKRKENKELVKNALNNKKFVKEFNELNKNSLPKDFKDAYEYVEDKYRANIKNYIDKNI